MYKVHTYPAGDTHSLVSYYNNTAIPDERHAHTREFAKSKHAPRQSARPFVWEDLPAGSG
jgi:hypothetical protein